MRHNCSPSEEQLQYLKKLAWQRTNAAATNNWGDADSLGGNYYSGTGGSIGSQSSSSSGYYPMTSGFGGSPMRGMGPLDRYDMQAGVNAYNTMDQGPYAESTLRGALNRFRNRDGMN